MTFCIDRTRLIFGIGLIRCGILRVSVVVVVVVLGYGEVALTLLSSCRVQNVYRRCVQEAGELILSSFGHILIGNASPVPYRRWADFAHQDVSLRIQCAEIALKMCVEEIHGGPVFMGPFAFCGMIHPIRGLGEF